MLEEGFWNAFKTPLRIAGGTLGAATKGIAKTLDYVAPQITQPLHSLERGLRDIGSAMRTGWDVGSGGRQQSYKDILKDSGYYMDEKAGVTKSGKNHVVSGWRILGTDEKGNLVPDTKSRKLTFLFDKDNRFKIVSTATQDSSSLSQYGTFYKQKPLKPVKSKKNKKPKTQKAN
jgi:hypothetical protein